MLDTVHLTQTTQAVPCARFPGFGAGQLVHPEGVCACFHGGPAPVRAITPAVHGLAPAPESPAA